jgi:deoxycytidylate deaminase
MLPAEKNPNHPKHPYSWENVPKELLLLFSEQIDPEIKHDFMVEAITEAHKSSLRPTVGAVVVRDSEIIGRGYRKSEKLRENPPVPGEILIIA